MIDKNHFKRASNVQVSGWLDLRKKKIIIKKKHPVIVTNFTWKQKSTIKCLFKWLYLDQKIPKRNFR